MRRLITVLMPLLVLSVAGCPDDDPVPADNGQSDVRALLDADDPSDVLDTGASDLAVDEPAEDGGETDTVDGDSGPPDTGIVDTGEVDARIEVDMEPPFDPGEFDNGELVDFNPSELSRDQGIFPLAVQAGEMHADRVVLWTWVPDMEPVTIQVWRLSSHPGRVYLVHEEDVTPEDGGYVHVPVDGLAPGTFYQYAFLRSQGEGDKPRRSDVGRVRTALAPGSLEPLVIGGTSCTKQSFMPWIALSEIAARDVDLIVLSGDMSYNDGAETIEEYRTEWRNTLSDPHSQQMLRSAGMYSTWDDHEVEDDFDSESVDANQLAAAYQAYFEHLARVPGPNGELWNSYLWGDTAEIIVLDCRGERKPSTRRTTTPEYISEAQMDWLLDRLENSPAHFKIIVNSVPITDMPFLWDVAATDRWEGYGRQREQLLDFIIDNDIQDVWFLSGDFHLGFVSHVEPEGPGHRIHEVALGPGGNGPNPLYYTLEDNDQFPLTSNYMEVVNVITFDPISSTVRVQAFDAQAGEIWDQTFE